MKPYNRIWIIGILVLVLSYLVIPILGDTSDINWFMINRNRLVFVMLLFIFLSGIGYWINRKKEFGLKMFKWHLWSNYIGAVLIFIAIIGHYIYDVSIIREGFEIDHFREKKVNLVLLVFLSSLILTIGFCIYIVNLIISNYRPDKEE